MRLIKGKTGLCVVTAAAMILNDDPERIIEWIGHTGEEEIFPGCPPPFNQRGHSIEEIRDYAFKVHGCLLIHTVVDPILIPTKGELLVDPVRVFRDDYLFSRAADYLMLGPALLTNKTHAVAYNNETQEIYDPSGMIYDIRDFVFSDIYTALRIESNTLAGLKN